MWNISLNSCFGYKRDFKTVCLPVHRNCAGTLVAAFSQNMTLPSDAMSSLILVNASVNSSKWLIWLDLPSNLEWWRKFMLLKPKARIAIKWVTPSMHQTQNWSKVPLTHHEHQILNIFNILHASNIWVVHPVSKWRRQVWTTKEHQLKSLPSATSWQS